MEYREILKRAVEEHRRRAKALAPLDNPLAQEVATAHLQMASVKELILKAQTPRKDHSRD